MKLLERLINAHGVSGNEEEVRRIIVRAIRPLVDEVRIDASGNVVAHKDGADPDFMLAAHMDEIGLMVREITPSGLLLCAAIGGVNPLGTIGMRVTATGAKEPIHGIVTTREISCGEDVEEMPGVDGLVVDTGLTRKKLKRLGVAVGSFLEPRKQVNWLTYGNTISGKALDNRLGCYCLIEVARRLRRVDREVYYVFTVQEEIGMESAKTSAFAIRPQWAIVVDATAANDLSGETEKVTGTHLVLGKGPCVLHMEEGFIPNARLVRAIQQVAERHHIAVQHEVSSFGTTDASKISGARRGVPSANVSIAIRNVHSTVEIANRRDVEDTIQLVAQFLRRPPASLLKSAVPQKGKARRPGRRKGARRRPSAGKPRRRAASRRKRAVRKRSAKRRRS